MKCASCGYPISETTPEFDAGDHVSLREPAMHWEVLGLLFAAMLMTYGAPFR